MESVLETYLGGVQNGVAAAVAATSATVGAATVATGALYGGGEPDDIPKTNAPVWILGRKYCAIQGKQMSCISRSAEASEYAPGHAAFRSPD